ncbi:MAG TPA: FAD-binding protein [Jatrophihabitans sp.]|nr:FAD-binding protein [Jatrophihabitans sp.]
MTSTTPVLDRLAVDLDGTLVRPTDPGWDTARLAWQLATDQRPAAVVLAASVRDVQATVLAAAELGLRVAPQGTGHNAAPLGELTDTILLKTSALRGVQIDAEARIARAEAGAMWLDVTPLAAKHGLAGLAGSASDVGVVGYTLGGGLSWLGRTYGLAANSVVAMEVVTADGRLRRIDAGSDPELFWALRGGGGSYAIVTAIEFRLYPVAEVYAGVLFFPITRAEEVLQAWREWLPSVPDTVSSVGRLLKFPPLPDLPPHLSGQAYVVVEAACMLPADEAEELLAPLRALGPAIDTFRVTPVEELAALHMDPDGPVPGSGDGLLLAELPAEAVRAVARFAAPDVPLLSVEVRHLGGALTPGRTAAGAVDGIAGGFAFFAVGIAPTPEAMRAVQASVVAAQHALAPWSASRCYANFAESRKTGAALFGADTHRRLQSVKAAYDPADLIRANHPVTPA